MSRGGNYQLNPLFFNNLNHSTPDWLENRVNRATFAATGYTSMILAISEKTDVFDKDSLGDLFGKSIRLDTIYILRLGRSVAALYFSENEGLLIKYTPSSGEATYERLIISNHGEDRTNAILESMILKGTIDAYYHVEYEEFLVMSDTINQSIQKGEQTETEDEDATDEDNDAYDEDDLDDDEDDTDDMNDNRDNYDENDEDDYDSDSSSRHYWDDSGRFYGSDEDWYADHLNPPGTIDCGDGYIDDDGVFTEY